MNQPPDYCPYCGTDLSVADDFEHGPSTLETVGTPSVFRCGACEEYVFYNAVPGGSTVVVDGDRLLLVEDFRSPGEWKLPSGRVELGERPSEGVARELEEETGLAVDPDALELVRTGFDVDDPDDGSYLSVTFAVEREHARGSVVAGAETSDAQFWPFARLREDHDSVRSVDLRRIEAAVERLRGEAVDLPEE
jgi:ADP-ribose pyrophosphatase YjhB (NUDIX family)